MSSETFTIDYFGGHALVQVEGTVRGFRFYFRSRFENWTFSLSELPDVDPVDIDAATSGAGAGFIRVGHYGTGLYDASDMPEGETLRIIQECAEEYLRERNMPFADLGCPLSRDFDRPFRSSGYGKHFDDSNRDRRSRRLRGARNGHFIAVSLGIFLTGVILLTAGLLWNDGGVWRFVGIGGGVLSGIGVRLTMFAVIERYGSLKVPTWLGVLILLAILAVLPLVALCSWMNEM